MYKGFGLLNVTNLAWLASPNQMKFKIKNKKTSLKHHTCSKEDRINKLKLERRKYLVGENKEICKGVKSARPIWPNKGAIVLTILANNLIC